MVSGIICLLLLLFTIILWVRSYRQIGNKRGEIYAIPTWNHRGLWTFDSLAGICMLEYISISGPDMAITNIVINDSRKDAHQITCGISLTKDRPPVQLFRTSSGGTGPNLGSTITGPMCIDLEYLKRIRNDWTMQLADDPRTPGNHGFGVAGGRAQLSLIWLDAKATATMPEEGTRFILRTPYWGIAAFVALLLALLTVLESRSLRKQVLGLCPTCSYNLREHLSGNAGPNCPECGTPISGQRTSPAPPVSSPKSSPLP